MFARFIVSAFPGIVGAVVPGDAFFSALDLSTRAKADGFEGRVFGVLPDGDLIEFNHAARKFAAVTQSSPFGADLPEVAAAKAARGG